MIKHDGIIIALNEDGIALVLGIFKDKLQKEFSFTARRKNVLKL